MIWKNINIGILAFFILVLSMFSTLSFLKIDIATTAILLRNDFDSIIVSSNDGKYLESNNITNIAIRLNNQYYRCNIEYSSCDDKSFSYAIYLPKYLEIIETYQDVNLILDSVNFYQYFLIKK